MTTHELRDHLVKLINDERGDLDASVIEDAGTKAVIGIEDQASGTLYFLEVNEA